MTLSHRKRVYLSLVHGMARPSPENLAVIIAIAALMLLFGGAPLGLAIPVGLLVWILAATCRGSLPRFAGTLRALLCLYPLHIGIIQYSYWSSGQQGIDFGIFSQLIYQVAEHNRFMTSLISTEWQNFITHHFSPFLILLGGVAKLGVSAEVTLISAHVIAVAFLIWGVLSLGRTKGAPLDALLLTAIALVLPGVRRALGWETHDEVLALPFIVWSLVAHLKGRTTLRLLLLFPPLLFKETFGLVMCTTAIGYLIADLFDTTNGTQWTRRSARLVALSGLFFFMLVTQVLPGWLWVSTFDPTTRLANLHELVDIQLLKLKARWLLATFLPGLPFVFLHTRETVRTSLILLSPALYNIAAIMSTNFIHMLDPYNYYSISPAILGLCAISLPVLRHPKTSLAILCSLSLAVVCGNTVRSSKIIGRALSAPAVYDEIRVFVPRQSAVIVDDYTASVLADNDYLQRVYHARRTRTEFDYIVTAKSTPEHLSETLKNRSVPCHETPRYQIRCRR